VLHWKIGSVSTVVLFLFDNFPSFQNLIKNLTCFEKSDKTMNFFFLKTIFGGISDLEMRGQIRIDRLYLQLRVDHPSGLFSWEKIHFYFYSIPFSPLQFFISLETILIFNFEIVANSNSSSNISFFCLKN